MSMSKKTITKANNSIVQDTYRTSHIIIGLIAATAALLTILIISIILLSSPVADDLGRLEAIPRQGFFGYLNYSIHYIDGRFSNAVLMAASITLFGSYGLKIVLLLIYCSLVLSLTWIAWSVLQDKIGKRNRTIVALSAGLMGAAAIIFSAYSIFDTIAWFNASCIYLAGLTAGLLSLAYGLHLYKLPSIKLLHYALLFLFCFIAQGFNEPVAATLIISALTVLALSIIIYKKNLHIRYLSLAALTGYLLGFAAVYFAPGTSARAALLPNEHTGLLHSLRMAFDNFSYLTDYLTSMKFVYPLLLSVSVLIILQLIKYYSRRLILAIGAFLIIVPTAVTGFIVNYTHTIDEHGLAPFRTSIIITATSTIGLALVAAIAWSYLPKTIYNKHRLVVVFIGILCITALHNALPRTIVILKAESLRSSLLSYRNASIAEQLTAKKNPITVTPAPVLVDETQADDLLYLPEDQQNERWFYKAFSKIYRLGDTSFTINTQQPVGYCLNNISKPWWGVRSCHELATILWE